MFKHVVITRFNLRHTPFSTHSDEEWIRWTRDRIAIFNTYCLPSFINQTTKRFTWMIYFDKDTPQEFHPFIHQINRLEFIEVLFAEGHDHFLQKCNQDVQRIANGEKWIIQTRCDNDDSLHQSAIQNIQSQFRPKDKFMISLVSGYALDASNRRLSHYYNPTSPFISIIEENKKEEMIGIFNRSHAHWERLKLNVMAEILDKNDDSCFIIRKTCWMQIIHGENVLNNFFWGIPVLASKPLSDFGLKLFTQSQSVFDILKCVRHVQWKNYLKSSIVRMLKKA